MEDFIQFSAKTKSEAITKACIELGVSSDQLEIQVISEGSNGFFGIGSKPAVIKVRKIESVSEEEEMKEIVETVKLDSFKEEAPVQEEKKTEAIKPVKKEIKEPKAVSEKPRQPKPVKERAAKEKQPREFREPKEKQVREKTAKPVKPAKPVEILTDDKDWVTGIRCILMELGEPDASGRRRPVEIPGSEFEIEVDEVIMSLGTSPNPLISSTTYGLDVNRRKCIVAEEETGKTSKEGVYAGGDAVTGAATVILAMGAGKAGAKGIDEYIKSKNA